MRNALLYGCLNDLKNRLIQLENWGESRCPLQIIRAFQPSCMGGFAAFWVFDEIIHYPCEAAENSGKKRDYAALERIINDSVRCKKNDFKNLK